MSADILNLDELFGQSKPVIVEWKGKRYEMLRPEGLTLEQNNRWNTLAKKLVKEYGSSGQRLGQGDTGSGVKELDQAMNECLELLCPALLADEKPLKLGERIQRKLHPERFEERVPLTFNQKFQILEFYSAEVFKKIKGKGKGPSKNLTGA
jgi:hypothetical protein